MNRRQFIRNTSLAAAFVGVSPVFKVMDNAGKKKQKIIFIFRGVGFVDGFNAFKSFNLQSNPGFHIQKVKCINPTYSHTDGLRQLLKGIKTKKVLIQRSELVEKSTIADIIQSTFSMNAKNYSGGAYASY